MKYRYLVYLILLLPLFIFRDYTPANELKYISIVEEAIEDGNWFTFYNHGEIYADKPPLYFWLMMFSRLLTGGYHMWLMGLFTLIPAIGILWLMDKWLRKYRVEHNPLASNVLLLTTGIFTGGALVLRMDMMMTFFIVLSLYTFFKIYKQDEGRYDRWLLPVWIFLALFSKGAMGILIPLVSMIAFLAVKGKLKSFGRYMGLGQWGILIGLCAVWFGMIYVEGGNEYLNNILFKQTVGRGINSFHHKENFFFYFKRILLTFAPWSLLYLSLLWYGIRNKKFGDDLQRFFLTIIWVNFLMLSLISSKIDIYMLPIYPFIVYLACTQLKEGGRTLFSKIAFTLPLAIFILMYPASFIAVGKLPYEFANLFAVRLGLLFLTIVSIAALISVWKNKPVRAAVFSGALLVMMFCASFAVPQFNQYLGLGILAEDAERTAQAEEIEDYAYFRFYTAQNMDVYLGKDLLTIDEIPTLDSLDGLPNRTILFVRDREIRRDEQFAGWMDGREEIGRTAHYFYIIVGKDEPTSGYDIDTGNEDDSGGDFDR